VVSLMAIQVCVFR